VPDSAVRTDSLALNPHRRGLLAEIAKDYGTPAYLYDLTAVHESYRALKRALPDGIDVYYSAKANPHVEIISTLSQLGARAEVSSPGELESSLTAAVPPSHILYTGPAKTVGELVHAIERGVRLFSVESEADRNRLAACATDADVSYVVRLASAGGGGSVGVRMTGRPSQFGVDPAALMPGASGGGLLSSAGRARPVGFHVFSASNAADEDSLIAELAQNINTVAATIKATGFSPNFVDIGGGFGAPYAAPGTIAEYPRLRASLTEQLDEALPGWRAATPRVAIESGRYLAGAAGALLTTIMDIKYSDGHTFLLCDAGINVLGGMYGLGRLVAPKAQPAGQSADSASAVLTGPLCTPLDVLSWSANVEEPSIGDLLIIPNVGAYGLSASLIAFMSRPLPVELVLNGSKVLSARRLYIGADSLRVNTEQKGQ
jgi:diaminopimelate decarboxylase